jgi:hypothetical protein
MLVLVLGRKLRGTRYQAIQTKGYGQIMKALNPITPEKVERSEMDVKIEYMPPVMSTSRPFQVSLYLYI